jgi:dimethylglycine dehydrogenase
MKTHARIVVIGGGMMGASLLYHLAKDGCTDTLLIEKSELTSGSTWHAAGQCPSITGSYNLAKIHAYGNALYPQLESITGQYVSWHGSGGLRLATNERELAWLKYVQGYSKSIGFSMEIVGHEQIKKLNPFLTLENVIAAAWTTDDGHADPSGLCNALAKGARDLGAQIVRHNRVVDIKPLKSGEWQVVTEQGTVTAEMVVNAAGCYADEVAKMVGGSAPITNMQHHYLVTHPVPEFKDRSTELPVMRDPYTSGYYRQEQKSGLIGVYESTGLQEAWAPSGVPTWEASNELFPDDLERITPWLERVIERMPILGAAGIRRIINGAIPHTPDGAPLLGPAPGIKNFWMCCGSSFGIAQGAGCGKYLAQWMLQGDAEINMLEFDPRRFGAFADESYRREKAHQDYSLTFTTRGPGEEDPAARPRRVSPLYQVLKDKGAVYAETFGWERPKWFSANGAEEDYSYRRNNVFQAVRGEVAAAHERLALLDLSGFAKFDVTGAGAEGFLNRICANFAPRKVGGIALVHLLSRGGNILGEMTLSRLGPQHFFALSAAAAEWRDQDLLLQSVQDGEDVHIQNLTDAHGVLVLNGPHSRELLQPLTVTDLSNSTFPYLHAREIDLAGVALRLLRMSYAGEMGYELHAPMDSLSALYDTLWREGQRFGIADYGLYAANSMRLEKGYKAWGSELTNELNMLEADMPRFIRFEKPDFVGKAATQARPPRNFKIAYVNVAATDADVRGGEPVMAGERCIGVATSGGYGHRVQQSLAFVSVEPAFADAGMRFDIIIQGERRSATVLPGPAFDPDNRRMKI